MKNKQNTQAIIAEIHNTFYNAGDKLLAEANQILNTVGEVRIEKAKRLKSLGFVNSVDVQEWEKVKVTDYIAKTINEYNMIYPNNKFITEEQVELICKKYNLMCAPISFYKGFVPESKVSDIERFMIHRVHRRDLACKNIKFMYEYTQQEEKSALKKKYKDGIYPVPVNSYIEDIRIESYDLIDNQSMMICAPKKDFNLKWYQKMTRFFQSVKRVEIPDPVVLQPCKGGYLIVTAWGDEASDEIVVNQNHN